MRGILAIIFSFFFLSSFGQIGGKLPNLKPRKGFTGKEISDSIPKTKRTKRSEVVYSIHQYKKFFIDKDSIPVDTVLTVRQIYRLNYTLKDDLLLLPFQNMGLGFIPLTAVSPASEELIPNFVAGAKSYNNWSKYEVPFYQVPSAYSDLFYLNGISQGQMLRAFITTNINPDLNFQIGYKGISSLGLYRHSATSLGRFFFSTHFRSKNKKYKAKLFYVTHDLMNEENGGLKDPLQFESGNPDFYNRSRIEVNFIDAKTRTFNKQFYWNQSYLIWPEKHISIQNEFYSQREKYIYEQTSPSPVIGQAFTTGQILDSTSLNLIQNDVWAVYHSKNIQFKTGFGYVQTDYKWDSIKQISGQIIPKELLYKDISWNSKLRLKWKKLSLEGKLKTIPGNDLQSYLFSTSVIYKKDSLSYIKTGIKSQSKKPDFKYILFQSAYEKLNWYNPGFSNEQLQELSFEAVHKKWGKVKLRHSIINNYTYFGLDTLPHQYTSIVSYSAIHVQNDWQWNKFGLASDMVYQKVLSGEEVLSLPEFVIRESLYYSNRFFRKHLHFQTGFTIKYFSSFYAPAYHPVLADYILQRNEKIGDFMLLDYFVNFKVKRFRFYLKAEHLNAIWGRTAPKYYTAPGYPMRDFSLRFGINWIFFN